MSSNLCPVADILWIVREIFDLANRFVFANIACYPARATLPTGENAHSTVRHLQWRAGLFRALANDFEAVDYRLNLVTFVRQPDGSKAPHFFTVSRQRY